MGGEEGSLVKVHSHGNMTGKGFGEEKKGWVGGVSLVKVDLHGSMMGKGFGKRGLKKIGVASHHRSLSSAVAQYCSRWRCSQCSQ